MHDQSEKAVETTKTLECTREKVMVWEMGRSQGIATNILSHILKVGKTLIPETRPLFL
jgi:hypothetical protein